MKNSEIHQEISDSSKCEFIMEFRKLKNSIAHLHSSFDIKLEDDEESEIEIKIESDKLFEILLDYEVEIRGVEFGGNAKNFLYHRDRWVQFSWNALGFASEFFRQGLYAKAWLSLNIATRYIAKAEVISRMQLCAITEIENKRKRSATRKTGEITKKAKKLLMEIFRNHAPTEGWSNIKTAIHQIKPHLLEEMKGKAPNKKSNNLESEFKEQIKSLSNWMRNDEYFRMSIERHLQNKAVPDLTNMSFFAPASYDGKDEASLP